MKYLSICSGIEAASVAWEPLGWTPLAFSEIEQFPRDVLQHHYPDVPLHGDFTKLRDEPWVGDADVLVGGTPCQGFSIAGLRKSLDDDRSNLALEFVRLADAIDDLRSSGTIIVWENVPGVLNVKDNAFGCFMAALVGDDRALVPPRGKWSNAGMVAGPKRRAAWRVLDAQYFGLAQRRRRVFVVASARTDFDPAEVLFEREGVQRHTAPRREAGKSVAADVAPSLVSSGRGVERPGDTRGQDPVVAVYQDVSHCLNAGGMGRIDNETESFVIAPEAFRTSGNCGAWATGDRIDALMTGTDPSSHLVAHTLRASHDASEDGTGRGTPIVPVAYDMRGRDGGAQFEGPHETANIRAASGGSSRSYVLYSEDSLLYKGIEQNGDENGRASETDTAEILRAMRQEIGEEAFTEWGLGISDSFQSPKILRSKVHGNSVRCKTSKERSGMGDSAPPCAEIGSGGGLREMRIAGRERRSPQGWKLSKQRFEQFAAALSQLSQQRTSTEKFMFNLWEASEGIRILRQALSAVQKAWRPVNGEDQSTQPRWAVRRLTVVECEKLMGFPDGWTDIPRAKGKPAADGPRYKSLGNSMAVPVIFWIGKRIQMAVDISNG